MMLLTRHRRQLRAVGQIVGVFFVLVVASEQHSVQASMWRPECDEACPELMNHFKAIDLDSNNHTGVKWKCRAEMKKCVVMIMHRLLTSVFSSAVAVTTQKKCIRNTPNAK